MDVFFFNFLRSIDHLSINTTNRFDLTSMQDSLIAL